MPDVRSFNIEAFKARFGDGAKANLFYYQPAWPSKLSADITTEDSIFLVKTATMPSTTLEEGIVPWQGFDWKYPSKKTYSDVTVSFNVDKSAKIRGHFEKWMNLIHDPKTNFWNYHDVYMANQRLQMIGYQGQVILEFVLHDAWPKEVAQISMDYGTADIATFDVTFAYSYHEVSYAETGGAAARK
jgi:hypothetical protein